MIYDRLAMVIEPDTLEHAQSSWSPLAPTGIGFYVRLANECTN